MEFCTSWQRRRQPLFQRRLMWWNSNCGRHYANIDATWRRFAEPTNGKLKIVAELWWAPNKMRVHNGLAEKKVNWIRAYFRMRLMSSAASACVWVLRAVTQKTILKMNWEPLGDSIAFDIVFFFSSFNFLSIFRSTKSKPNPITTTKTNNTES